MKNSFINFVQILVSDDEEATDVDMISLSGAKVSTEKSSKFSKYVVRVVTYKQLFFGFENVWERNIWTGWLRRVSYLRFQFLLPIR